MLGVIEFSAIQACFSLARSKMDWMTPVYNGASNLILKLIGLEAAHPEVSHTAQELRTMLARLPATTGLSLNRLLLLENIFDLGQQAVKDAMVPWSNVRI